MGIYGRLILTEVIPNGALAIYDKDQGQPAFVWDGSSVKEIDSRIHRVAAPILDFPDDDVAIRALILYASHVVDTPPTDPLSRADIIFESRDLPWWSIVHNPKDTVSVPSHVVAVQDDAIPRSRAVCLSSPEFVGRIADYDPYRASQRGYLIHNPLAVLPVFLD